MTRWEAIEESFIRLRDFALTDIEGFASNRTGGNYGLVGLIVAACDALGGRCYGGDSGHLVLRRCLPDEWKPVSDIVYDALRHGLIHMYDPMIVMDAARRALVQSADLELTRVSESRDFNPMLGPVFREVGSMARRVARTPRFAGISCESRLSVPETYARDRSGHLPEHGVVLG